MLTIISLVVTTEGRYPKPLEVKKISRSVTTNTITYGMRTVTPIQFIDKTDNQKTDTRTIGMYFKTSDVDTNTANTMITRILTKHHMEFTAKNILTNLIIYKITRGQIA